MTRARAVGAVLVGLVLAGCGTAGTGVTSGPRSTASAPRTPAIPDSWREPADYRFTVESSCGERSFIGVYRVTVRGGEVVAARLDDPVGGRTVVLPSEELQWVPTLDDMLEEAQSAAGDPEAGEVVVRSDPADGHPTSVRVDAVANAIDDESCYEVTDYQPGG